MSKSEEKLINQAVDYIINFENKNINTACLFSIGRSGSILLQTLFDAHEEVLMIPQILPFSFIWESSELNIRNIEKEITKLCNNDFFNINWGINYFLGENREQSYKFPSREIKNIILKIIEKINVYDQKTIFLSLHFAYAIYNNQKLENIRLIFFHHHYTRYVKSFISMDNNLDIIDKTYFNDNIDNLKNFLRNFSKIKLIFTIRSPMETYISFRDLATKKEKTLDIQYFIYSLYNTYISFRDMTNLHNEFECIYVKFEELHKNSEKIMNMLAKATGIKFEKSLLNSSVDNKKWWGPYPDKALDTFNPDIKTDRWKSLEKSDLVYSYFIFCDLIEYFNYEKPVFQREELNNILKTSVSELQNLTVIFFNIIYFTEKQDNSIIFLELYPYFRKKFLNYINTTKSNDFELTDLSIDNCLNVNNLKLCLINSIKKTLIDLSDQAYLILIKNTSQFPLEISDIDRINQNADQLWVNSEYLRKLYINQGIDPEIIKLIPYEPRNLQINIHKSKLYTFLTVSDSRINIQSIINSFCEEFSPDENVFMIIREIKTYKQKSSVVINNNKYFNKIRFIPAHEDKNSIFDNDCIELIESYFSESDCFIYPNEFLSENLFIIEALSAGLDLITINQGNATDIKDVLTKESIISAGYDEENERYFPDYQELKKAMRFMYENKSKTNKNREKLFHKFNNISINQNIEKVLENLKQQKPKRLIIKDIINDYMQAGNKFLKNNDFHKAEYYFRKVSYLDKNNQECLRLLTKSLIGLDKYEEAIDSLYILTELSYPDTWIFNMIAFCLEKTGNIELADIYYLKALTLKNNDN